VGKISLQPVKTKLLGGFCLWGFQSNDIAGAFYKRNGFLKFEFTRGDCELNLNFYLRGTTQLSFKFRPQIIAGCD
jgi:hypothetical protein